MKSAILVLSLSLLTAASSAFADQCPSGDSIKINDDYSVDAPAGYRYLGNNMPITKTGPISSSWVNVDSSSYWHWGNPVSKITTDREIECWYVVNNSSNDGVFILTKNGSSHQTYDLGRGWDFDGRERAICIVERNPDCSFNLSMGSD